MGKYFNKEAGVGRTAAIIGATALTALAVPAVVMAGAVKKVKNADPDSPTGRHYTLMKTLHDPKTTRSAYVKANQSYASSILRGAKAGKFNFSKGRMRRIHKLEAQGFYTSKVSRELAINEYDALRSKAKLPLLD